MRNISAFNIAAAQSDSSYRVDFAELDINGQFLRLSTLYKDVVFDSKTFTAAGHLMSFSDISESLDAKQNSINVTLNGVDQAVVGVIADSLFLGSPITLYRGYWNDDIGTLVDDPYVVWKGIANDYAIAYGGKIGQENTVMLKLSCKNLLVSILESRNGRFTSVSSFQEHNSADTSMEFVASLSSFNPRFGADK